MESLVNQQTNELENFHEKVHLKYVDMIPDCSVQIEEILAENEALRDSHLDQMRQNEGPGGLNMGPMGPLNMELLNELNERVEILMTENALMVEQKAVLSKGRACSGCYILCYLEYSMQSWKRIYRI